MTRSSLYSSASSKDHNYPFYEAFDSNPVANADPDGANAIAYFDQGAQIIDASLKIVSNVATKGAQGFNLGAAGSVINSLGKVLGVGGGLSSRSLNHSPAPGLKPGNNAMPQLILNALASEFTKGNAKKVKKMFDLFYEENPFTITTRRGASDQSVEVLYAGDYPNFKKLSGESLSRAQKIYEIIKSNDIYEVVIIKDGNLKIVLPANDDDIRIATKNEVLDEYGNTGSFGTHSNGTLSNGGKWGFIRDAKGSFNPRLRGALIIDLTGLSFTLGEDGSIPIEIINQAIIEALLNFTPN